MKKIVFICLMVFICYHLNAELNYRKFFKNRAATKQWEKENFTEAEQLYRENAIENPNLGDFHYNRGTALYKIEEYDEAMKEFQIALNDRSFKDRDKIYHNMGNIALQKAFQNESGEDLQNAIELYQRSLIENPNNIDSRKNYEYARMITQPPDQQEQEQQQDQQQNNEEGDENQPPPPDKEDPDKKEAERMLQALEQKQEQEKDEQQQQGRPGPRGKYW
ncbi:MAG: hypothetical protein FWG20_01865 [Candidatus Cloacimonetes bacterium]|nr:hypothetical protein [Candidatus Cloacimonadota bacterium]